MESFRINFDENLFADLRKRVNETRWCQADDRVVSQAVKFLAFLIAFI